MSLMATKEPFYIKKPPKLNFQSKINQATYFKAITQNEKKIYARVLMHVLQLPKEKQLVCCAADAVLIAALHTNGSLACDSSQTCPDARPALPTSELVGKTPLHSTPNVLLQIAQA